MALPASGQISFADIRSELQLTSVSSFSIKKAEEGIDAGYVPINISSPSTPGSSNPAAINEWYSYNHTYAVSCPASVTNLGGRVSGTPYGEMWVVDLGTTSGNVDVTVNISSASPYGASITCDYGYPFNSSGVNVGGAGGTLFNTGLINSTYTTTATYNYNAAYGQKAYVYIVSIQNSNNWPRFAVTMSCPYPSGYSVTFYAAAGSDITNGDEFNVYYSEDGTNWVYLAGPLSSISCTELSTQTINSSTLYVKATKDSNGADVFYGVSNSTFCPGNTGTSCGNSYSLPLTGNTSVALTAKVTGGGLVEC